MKKFFLLIALLLTAGQAAQAYNIYGKRQPYHIALHVCNPLGLASKYGGGLEYRQRRTSLLFNYYKYMGVYPGFQMAPELDFFLHSRKRHEFYIYGKGVIGTASYNGAQLGFLGYSTDITYPASAYVGGGAGMGRRFNFNHFFITLCGGFKYCTFTDKIPKDQLHLYNLDNWTGPGAYVDLHMQFGIQF